MAAVITFIIIYPGCVCVRGWWLGYHTLVNYNGAWRLTICILSPLRVSFIWAEEREMLAMSHLHSHTHTQRDGCERHKVHPHHFVHMIRALFFFVFYSAWCIWSWLDERSTQGKDVYGKAYSLASLLWPYTHTPHTYTAFLMWSVLILHLNLKGPCSERRKTTTHGFMERQ